ncbi:hypothetical protein C8R48DRAFT_676663 [Suillus tomentosus]|nr:hypothetical protein C8R48DRAFT_676663 [Suillus tomentosus]
MAVPAALKQLYSGYETPIKHGSSIMVPFSTNARYLINTINGLGKEVLPFTNRGDDPFSTLSSSSSFIMSSQQARDMMGQITAYTSAQLAHQDAYEGRDILHHDLSGTWQFMYMNTPHDFQDNMESMLYVILWIMFIFTVSWFGWFQEGKLPAIEVFYYINSPLFKGHPALDTLMQQLQKMFSARYIPTTKEAEENVRLAKLRLDDPIVKMALQDNLVAIKLDGLEAMKSHEGIINIFNTHLD